MAQKALNMIHGQDLVLEKKNFIEAQILAQEKLMIDPFTPMTTPTNNMQGTGAIVNQVITGGLRQGKQYNVGIRTVLKGDVIANNDSIEGTGESLDVLQTGMHFERIRKSVFLNTDWERSGSEMYDTLGSTAVAQQSLANYFVRHFTQQKFDALCGFRVSTTTNEWDKATNIVTLQNGLNRAELINIENIAKRGRLRGGMRTETIDPFTTYAFNEILGESYVLIVPDLAMDAWRLSQEWELLSLRDIRGKANMIFHNTLHIIGNVAILSVPLSDSSITTVSQESGTAGNREIGITASDFRMRRPGLRVQDNTGKWLGEAGFNYDQVTKARGLLLGRGALATMTMGGIQYTVQKPNRDGAIAVDSEGFIGMKKVQWTSTSGEREELITQLGYDLNMLQIDIPVQTSAFPKRLQMMEDATKGQNFFVPAQYQAEIDALKAEIEALKADKAEGTKGKASNKKEGL